MKVATLMSLVLTINMVGVTIGHGAVTIPKSRNSVDGSLAPWNGTVPEAVNFMFWCANPDANAFGKDPRNVTGTNGQACFWFNNGCDISCDTCDGSTGQVIHPQFIYTGTGNPPSFTGEGIVHDPKQNLSAMAWRPDGDRRLSICKTPKHNATICDPKLRTINADAPCGSPEDVYYFAPWRYPGAAPVIDSCGVAGGVHKGEGPASAGGDYHNTSNAKLGDIGSQLPPLKTNTVWTAGEVVEVAWTHKAWHGGGYQYRLCPADKPLNEDCFQATPVPFADGTSSLRWGGVGAEQIWFNATDVSTGVIPEGATWRRGPIPRAPWGWQSSGATFEAVCDEPEICLNAHERPPTPEGHSSQEGAYPCKCSGWGIGDLYTLEIVDKIRLPSDLAAGEWVLGWRWDCEESTQVWASCSDVTINKSNVQSDVTINKSDEQ